jgi:membrane fusion protein, copper/silver efflux system
MWSSRFPPNFLLATEIVRKAYRSHQEPRVTAVSPKVRKIRNPNPGWVLRQYPGVSRALSRIWIFVDLFENESQYVATGLSARVTLPHQNLSFTAKVSNIPAIFEPATKTLKVRLETVNPQMILRPDMFVDVELPVKINSTLVVPADAVIDTGLKTRVFVDRSNGFFEPREVVTGWRFGGRVEILKGLMEGERIVVSATFLIDSESRMKSAALQTSHEETAKDPICGMDIKPAQAKATGRTSQYQDKTYYFCSDKCKQDFDKNPQSFIQ